MIRRALRVISALALLGAPLLLLVLKVPVRKEFYSTRLEFICIGLAYAGVLLIFAGRLLASLLDRSRLAMTAVILLVLSVPAVLFFQPFPLNMTICAAFLGLLCFSWGVFGAAKTAPAPAILSLAVFLSALLAAERLLDSVSPAVLLQEITSVPPLAPVDRGNALYRKAGFRGKRPCVDCADKGIRIFTMGGSSTFGTPMFYSGDAYAARLSRMLKDSRGGEPWEVYNAGIPGYGIMQIQDSIEKEIKKFKPDIITICAWFNDHSAIPGWYGFQGKSDKEAHELVEMLRKIEGSAVYRKASGTRLYGLFRHWALRLQGVWLASSKGDSGKRPRRRPRMSPEEFKWGIDRITELSKQYGFIPVIVTEPTNHTPSFESAAERIKYYKVMQQAALEHDIPIINVLDDFAGKRERWLFYDFIHPNQAGHELIAENLYDALFGENIHPKLAALLAARGIDSKRPRLESAHFFQVPRSAMATGKITFGARLSAADAGEFALEMIVNDETTLIQTGLSAEFRDFVFQLDSAALSRPIADFKVAARNIETLGSGGTGPGAPLEIRAIQGR